MPQTRRQDKECPKSKFFRIQETCTGPRTIRSYGVDPTLKRGGLWSCDAVRAWVCFAGRPAVLAAASQAGGHVGQAADCGSSAPTPTPMPHSCLWLLCSGAAHVLRPQPSASHRAPSKITIPALIISPPPPSLIYSWPAGTALYEPDFDDTNGEFVLKFYNCSKLSNPTYDVEFEGEVSNKRPRCAELFSRQELPFAFHYYSLKDKVRTCVCVCVCM